MKMDKLAIETENTTQTDTKTGHTMISKTAQSSVMIQTQSPATSPRSQNAAKRQ